MDKNLKLTTTLLVTILPFLLCSCGEAAISSSIEEASSSEKLVQPVEASSYDEEAVEMMYRLHVFPFGETGGSFLDGKEPTDLAPALPEVEGVSLTPTYFGASYPTYPRLRLMMAYRAVSEIPSDATFALPCFAGRRIEIVFQAFSCYSYRPDYGSDATDYWREAEDAGSFWADAKLVTLSLTDGESILFLTELSPSRALFQKGVDFGNGIFVSTVSSGGLFTLLGRPFATYWEFVANVIMGVSTEPELEVPPQIREFFLFLYAGNGYVRFELPFYAIASGEYEQLPAMAGSYIDVREASEA